MSRADLLRETAALLGEITTARKHLALGRLVDLSGLDARAMAVSQAALAVGAKGSTELVPLLEEIVRACDALGNALEVGAPNGARRRE